MPIVRLSMRLKMTTMSMMTKVVLTMVIMTSIGVNY